MKMQHAYAFCAAKRARKPFLARIFMMLQGARRILSRNLRFPPRHMYFIHGGWKTEIANKNLIKMKKTAGFLP
jgi:hypothetical protein